MLVSGHNQYPVSAGCLVRFGSFSTISTEIVGWLMSAPAP
jgi:hypothetical protein